VLSSSLLWARTDLCIFTSESASLVIVCRMTKRMCVFNFHVTFPAVSPSICLFLVTGELTCNNSTCKFLDMKEYALVLVDKLLFFSKSCVVG
jgi:hypothetical protein